jgi:hypothetical protein
MYVIGASHPNKAIAASILERLTARGERLVTDAEVFQEILHRYSSIGRRDAIQPAFDLLEALVEEVYPVSLAHVKSARSILLGYPRLSSRDAIHAAIMQAHEVKAIASFDEGFDLVPGLERLSK